MLPLQILCNTSHFCWGVQSFARGAGSAKPAVASYGADGTLPLHPRDWSPNALTRRA